MEKKSEFIDDISDGHSILSQDRLSDDTDFLIGHNISFSNLNDSYIDARSSTTTDILYQQEIIQNEIIAATSFDQVNTERSNYSATQESPGSKSPLKTAVQNNHIDSSKYDKSSWSSQRNAEFDITQRQQEANLSNEAFQSNRIEATARRSSYESSGHGSKGFSQKESTNRERNSSHEGSKSQEMVDVHNSSKESSRNWKYRSVDGSSDEESFSQRRNSQILTDSFSVSLPENDPKVKEGEELLTKLLGKMNLTEALKSQMVASQDTNLSFKGKNEDLHNIITSPKHRSDSMESIGSKSKMNLSGSSRASTRKEGEFVRPAEWQKSSTAHTVEKRAENTWNSKSSLSDGSIHSKSSSTYMQYRTHGTTRQSTSSRQVIDERTNSVNVKDNLSGSSQGYISGGEKYSLLSRQDGATAERVSTEAGNRYQETSLSRQRRSYSSIGDDKHSSYASGSKAKRSSDGSINDQMIDSRGSINHQAIDSRGSINHQVTDSRESINYQVIDSRGSINHQVTDSRESINHERIDSKGSRVISNYDGEIVDERSRASSLEKYQRVGYASNEADIATSTPQRTNWPVSPIKRKTEAGAEELESLVAKNERKLKALKLEIEQETLRKKALLNEKSSAEGSLSRLKKNIQSLEQLAEEHKKQTVATRTELMDLEQQRNESQRKLNHVSEELNRQKKELELIPKELKEANISTKITMLQDERDELKRECKILREKCKDSDYVSNTNMDLMKKMRGLQEQLYSEQDSSREKLRALREELESERRKAVEANIEQLTTVRKIREEAMDAKKMEVDAIIERLEKDKIDEIEAVKDRYNGEVKSLQRRIEELEEDSRKLVRTSSDRLHKVQDQIANNHKAEIDIIVKRLKKEKADEIAAVRQRHKRENEELELQIKSKQSEIETLQALLKQQAESTRLLGEKLRNEAKDQICLAVEKERNTRLEELQRTELELEKLKDERDTATSGSTADLENKERENERLRNAIDRLKKELEDARQENYEAREEKFQAVSKTRQEMKERSGLLKEKLREVEKFEQAILLEINEECLKTSAVTGATYPTVKRNFSMEVEDNSAINEALGTLRRSNNDLRKMVVLFKKRLDESRTSNDSLNSLNQTNKSDQDSFSDRARTPDSMSLVVNGSSEESRSARILKHLQSRVKQLRQGNESMKKSFGSDEGENELDSSAGSATFEKGEDPAKVERLETALKKAEEQAERYANLLSQKMNENTKLQKMLTHSSKENIKLERLHSILQHKMATGGAT